MARRSSILPHHSGKPAAAVVSAMGKEGSIFKGARSGILDGDPRALQLASGARGKIKRGRPGNLGYNIMGDARA
jgi:hypothetical protein